MADENKNIKAYEQACNTIRHYSNMSFTARILAIVQGLVLLTAWNAINNNRQCDKVLLILMPLFGIVFTFFLFFFHKGYWDALDFLYRRICQMEENLFDEGFRPHGDYHNLHLKKYKKIWRRVLIIYAPFTFIGVLFFVTIIISICK